MSKSRRSLLQYGAALLLGCAIGFTQYAVADDDAGAPTNSIEASSKSEMPPSDVGVDEPTKDANANENGWKQSLNQAGKTIGSEASRLWGEIGKSSESIGRDASSAVKDGTNSALNSLDAAGDHISNETNKFLDKVTRSSKAFTDAWSGDDKEQKSEESK